MFPKPTPIRQVALLIESSRAYGRGLIRGVAAYAREHGNWAVRHQEMSIDADPPRWLSKWKGDGILVRIETPKMVRAIENLGIPAIDLRCWRSAGLPGFDTDDVSLVRLAVDHLRGRGYTRFGFCGFGGANYSGRRLAEMRKYLQSLGFELDAYESPGSAQATTVGAEQSGMLDEKGLTRWLDSLETPIGILASNDIRAQQLLNACHLKQIHVPDDVAVVGVDNDDVICPMCAPSLTSVEPDTRKIGYDAAALLEQMMAGEAHPEGITLVPARRIVVRGSTDSIPVDDEDFVKAYRFIRENACHGVSVQDVADAVPIPRRSLERRMRTYLDQTPADVIAAIRLARIKELLEVTAFPLKRIARMTGFQHDEHMAKFFRKHVGIPLGQYRKKHRLEAKSRDEADLDG